MNRYLILAFFVVFACNKPAAPAMEKPADLIPEEKMVQVLTDVHLLEAALNLRSPQVQRPQNKLPIELMHDTVMPSPNLNPDNKKALPWYNIFQKHGVTRAQYESSMKWYSTDPKKLGEMYEQVIVELTKRQTQERAGKK